MLSQVFKRTLNLKRHQVFKRAIMFLPCELSGDVSYDTAENIVQVFKRTLNPGLFFHHFENNSRISGAKITQGSEITQAFW